MGYGVYFIDVLACLLFCLVLALVGARFGREQTVDLDLPRMASSERAGADLDGPTLTVRSRAGGLQILLDGVALSLKQLEERLRASPPPSLLLRMERSALSDVVAAAHAAGVHEIRLAYDAGPGEEAP
jgi:biopolymer transport protein ExbD